MGGKEQTLDEFTQSIGRTVRAVFGEAVEVKAVNLYSHEAGQYPAVLDFVRNRPNVALPLITINGKVRFDGRVSPHWIIKVLRDELTA